jgi:hypothetical protein
VERKEEKEEKEGKTGRKGRKEKESLNFFFLLSFRFLKEKDSLPAREQK